MPSPTTPIKYALANALLTALYVTIIGMFFRFAPVIFGDSEPNAFIPILMLLLFVFSAALCGGLFLGRPLLWYLDGKKKEAITLFIHTLWIFFVVIVIMLFVFYLLK